MGDAFAQISTYVEPTSHTITDDRGEMVALRPPPRRLLSGAFDYAEVGGTHTRSETSAGTTAVIVVDAHPAFCAGIAQLLDDDFTIVGTAATVAELERLTAEAPHVRLVLIGETRDGDLRSAVSAIPEQARFAVFANEAHRAHVLAALELGASGYLLKNIRGETLSTTLRTIMAGARADDGSLAAMIEEYLTRRARRGYLVLRSGKRVHVSPREQQVAELLAHGASTRSIAEQLGVSAITVRRHVSALMRKLDVGSRDGMIRLLAA
jgi:two-component system, NarL family, response regulator DevR